MVKINSVMHGSPSDKCGVKKDDILVKINGHGIKDVLDYMYYAADTEVSLELLRGNETINLDISKDEYDDLGLEFETFLMDSKQSCSNKCVFCFIDLMPPGMRETLYFKDDDARLSFLQGNYVTLTNLHLQSKLQYLTYLSGIEGLHQISDNTVLVSLHGMFLA
jgi:NifB/MoaA-like Fe-S oxidoreductase